MNIYVTQNWPPLPKIAREWAPTSGNKQMGIEKNPLGLIFSTILHMSLTALDTSDVNKNAEFCWTFLINGINDYYFFLI